MKLYKCNTCGNIITKITDKNVPIMCCGKMMEELIANTNEAAIEKHKPVIISKDNKKYAHVGSITHPMTSEHYIEWIIVEYKDHQRIYHLNPNDEPEAKLCSHQEIIDIYAYCNLHGLWKMDK